MNYYYGNEPSSFYSPSKYFPTTYFHWPNGFPSLKSNHKRIVFSLVTLYLCYRLSCILFRLLRWMLRGSAGGDELENDPQQQQSSRQSILPQSRFARFLERTFIIFFGLAIGAVAYCAHDATQSAKMLEATKLAYGNLINRIVLHSTGFDLSKATTSLSSNETLILGSILAGTALYILYSMVRFLLYHYIFGVGLALLGLFLFAYQFPITADTAKTYSGTMFVIDRTNQVAYLVPSLIPKVLLTVTIGYYLALVFLKSFTLFLKISFRFLLYSVIATILLNSITTLLKEPLPGGTAGTTTTTFTTPDHGF